MFEQTSRHQSLSDVVGTRLIANFLGSFWPKSAWTVASIVLQNAQTTAFELGREWKFFGCF